MRAIVHHHDAPRDVLALEEIPQPVTGNEDVLIRVHAAGISYPDGVMTSGVPYILQPIPASPEKDLNSSGVHLLDEGRVRGDLDPRREEIVGGHPEVRHRRSADVDPSAEVLELAELWVRRWVPGPVQPTPREHAERPLPTGSFSENERVSMRTAGPWN